MKANKNTLCVLPWNHLFISNEGTVHTCCVTNRIESALRDSSGEKIVIDGPKDIEKAWSSEQLKKIRNQMILGEYPKQCSNCYLKEKEDLPSHRTIMNQEFLEKFESIIEDPQLEPPLNLEFLDLRFGNLCNLACRMCAPFSSVKLKNEWESFYGKSHVQVYKADQEVLNYVLKNGHQLKRVSCLGGEPFLMPDVKDFVSQLVERNFSKNIKLTFNSNMTIVNESLIQLWPSFKEVVIGASVDGFGEINDYIRYPSKWDTVSKNIDVYRKSSNVYLNCTVQIYNIFHLGELMEYAQKNKLFLKFNLLNWPEYLSIQALPQILKQKAKIYLMELLENYSGDNQLEGIIQHLFALDLSHSFPTFLKWTSHLDKSRDQDFFDKYTEFKEYAYVL